ncbi:MAG: hypothetical protein HC837_01645 [Chloroflexaceae bacterium]|nr:hypothetical protein [Chloroflexaceae bacterium]
MRTFDQQFYASTFQRFNASTLQRCCIILLTLMLLFTLLPSMALAQSEDWQEETTSNFVILYAPTDADTAGEYAGFVDDIYEEMATVFSHRVKTPITLRLYPTFESYYEVNPLAREMPGIVAHADFRRNEVIVVLPQTENQTPEQVKNNIRHELAHIIAADLSANRMNTGFQEGIAQYVEQVSPELEQKIALLNRAYTQNQLLPWSDFDDRDVVYGQPEISYPQTLSVVSFLIEQYGFAQFRNFVTISAQSSGYRSALDRAYSVAPADLEAQWIEWLPSYLNGGYRGNIFASFDLSYPQQLLSAGRYGEAQTELESALEWLQSQPEIEGDDEALQARQEKITEAQQLLTVSQQGQQAEQVATEAYESLQAHNYDRVVALAEQARQLYEALNDPRQNEVLQAYAERAERGRQANTLLQEAQGYASSLRFNEARESAEMAAAEFSRLGDTTGFESSLDVRRSLDSNKRLIGLILVTVGIVGAGISLFSQFFLRKAEVW